VTQLIDLRTDPPAARTRSYVHLMRATHDLCSEPELSRLAPRRYADKETGRTGDKEATGGRLSLSPCLPASLPSSDPLLVHEGIVYDWLAQGGKRSRPFITLAAYDALHGGLGTQGADKIDLPEAVRRAALAIE